MFRTLVPTCVFVLASLAAVPACADTGTEGLIAPSEARRYGLERSWFTQVQLDSARGRIRHMQYYVSKVESYTIYEVRYGDRKRKFSERDVNAFGEVVGKEGAKKAADEFVEDLKKQGVEGKVETFDVPETSLYVSTDRGVVHAIDGETGQTRWSALFGSENHPTERPGVNERYLAVLNGTTLFLVKRKTGEIAWSRKVQNVPGAGPAITDTYVVVPTVSGIVELYNIKEVRTLPEIYRCNGRVLLPPLASPQSIAWPTDRGFLYVAAAATRGVRYRLEAKDTIVSEASYYAPKRFFSASIDGYVYCLHEISGNEFWRFSAGEPISQTPIPTGPLLYVITDKGNMFCLNQETGAEQWVVPQLAQFVTASKDRLYCLGSLGRLVILDAKTGARIGSMNTEFLDLYYTNFFTDRLLVGSKTGVIQCLREAQLEFPLVHAGVEEPPEEGEKKPAGEPEAGTEGEPGKGKPAKPGAGKPGVDKPAAKDPFGMGDAAGGAADPFAAPAKPAAKGAPAKNGGGQKKDDEADPFAPAPTKPAAKGAPAKNGDGQKKDDEADPFAAPAKPPAKGAPAKNDGG